MVDLDDLQFGDDREREQFRQAPGGAGFSHPTVGRPFTGGVGDPSAPDSCANTFCTEDAETFRDYCPRHGPGRTGFEPRPSSSSTDIEALRRDVSRLEGKVDALLEALDAEVHDGDE